MKYFDLNSIVRENILKLQPYASARSEFTQQADVFIDANENPFESSFNRYPDPLQWELKGEISKIKGVPVKQIFLGNGSDEIIDLLMRCVCEPYRDNIVTFAPSYTMYETSASVNALEIKKLLLNEDFSIPMDRLKEAINENSKILFLCTPNNPMGCNIPLQVVDECCQLFPGIVVVDEAYIDFSSAGSAIEMLPKYPNMLVLQTLSKAYGMAGLRVGMGFASEEIVNILNKVKPPYNISKASQDLALKTLRNKEQYCEQMATLLEQRKVLYDALCAMQLFDKVYPSDANFVVATTPRFKDIYKYLSDNKVIARLRDIPPLLACGLRFSVGTPDENKRVIKLLETFKI